MSINTLLSPGAIFFSYQDNEGSTVFSYIPAQASYLTRIGTLNSIGV